MASKMLPSQVIIPRRRWHLGTGVNYSLNVHCCITLTHLQSLLEYPVDYAVRAAARWLFMKSGCTCGKGVNYSLNVPCCIILTHLLSPWEYSGAPAVRAALWRGVLTIPGEQLR